MIEPVTQKMNTNYKTPKRSKSKTTEATVGGALLGAGAQFVHGFKEYTDRVNELDDKCKLYEMIKEKPEIFELRQNMLAKVSDRGLRYALGMPVAPNKTVMFVSNSEPFAKNVIKWLMGQSGGNYKEIDMDKDDLLDVLESNEKNRNPKKWDFVYAKNMEKYIDHSQVDKATVEAMKDFMSATAEDYHTTLLFVTDNPKKLDYIALQPHRVSERFDLRGIKEEDFFNFKVSEPLADEIQKSAKQLKKDRGKIFAKPMAIGAAVAGAVGACVSYLYGRIKNENQQHQK